MPVMGGIEAAGKIFSEIPTEKRPGRIVALTADVFEESNAKCIQAGMSEVIHKPVEKKTLVDCLIRSSRGQTRR
jgi:CheY-like chemotaxis protein